MSMINVSQRQAGLAILGISSCSSWVALFLILVAQGGSFIAALPVLIGCVLFTSLLIVYLRDERLGRLVFPVLIIAFTAVITLGLPDEFVTDQVSLAILTPSLLSLVLLDTPWIVGVGAATIIGLLLRAQGHG